MTAPCGRPGRRYRNTPSLPLAYRWLAASLGQLGRAAEGAKVIDNLKWTFTPSPGTLVNRPLPYLRRNDYEHIIDGLAKAGWRPG
jgi:hypothetical protein